MVDKTDRDWRWVMRRITRRTLLYTEMITAPAVLHGRRDHILGFDETEHPLVLQLGWDEPRDLSEACRIAQDYGYDEINLNCGCPSDKVQRHDFGACLMARPDHAARLVEAMAEATTLPVTVKSRIGIRSGQRNISLEEYSHLETFIRKVKDAGCRKFIIHARIAVLEGLSPKENRDIPPLRPEEVYRLKEDFPELFIEINGGYRDARAIDEALKHVDAVMLGRIALDNPWLLAQADRRWFNHPSPAPARRAVLDEIQPYLARRVAEGASRGLLVQPVMNLFAGRPGAKAWKRHLSALVSGSKDHWEAGFRAAVSSMNPKLLDET